MHHIIKQKRDPGRFQGSEGLIQEKKKKRKKKEGKAAVAMHRISPCLAFGLIVAK